MRILIVTGASGGHIFPALALIDSLKDPLKDSSDKLLLVMPKKNLNKHILVAKAQVEYIPAANLTFKLSSKNIKEVFAFLSGAWLSLRIVMRFKPDAVVGFGSLNTVALMFWAWLFRIKTIIHEQNVIPGKANRLLAKLVDRVAISFEKTKNYLNVSTGKISVTGNPLRKELIRMNKKKALEIFGFKEGKFNILITGGSQGSHKLNTICFEAVSACRRKADLQVIHISGAEDFSVIKERYSGSALAFKAFDFFGSMQYAYSVADLVISRAGATTVAELQKFGIPAILIPYPFAYAHQEANARVLEDLKAALIIRDEELNADKLTAVLDRLLEDSDRLKSMQDAYMQVQAKDASYLLAKEVLNLN